MSHHPSSRFQNYVNFYSFSLLTHTDFPIPFLSSFIKRFYTASRELFFNHFLELIPSFFAYINFSIYHTSLLYLHAEGVILTAFLPILRVNLGKKVFRSQVSY